MAAHNPSVSTVAKWADNWKTIAMFAVFILGGFAYLVTTWIKINDNAAEIKILKEEMKGKAESHQLHDLDDKVIRQYGTQRTFEEKTNKDLEAVRAWIEYHKGYIDAQQGIKK